VSHRIGQFASRHTAFAWNQQARPPGLFSFEATRGFTHITAP
jgi:hypothetical protein